MAIEKIEILYRKRKEKQLRFFFLITLLLSIAVSTIFFISSRNSYLINLIVNIVLTISYAFYTIYFFTITIFNLNTQIAFIHKINNAMVDKDYLIFNNIEGEEFKNNIKLFKISFKTLDGEIVYKYSFEEILMENVVYYVESKLDYIVSFKAKDNA